MAVKVNLKQEINMNNYISNIYNNNLLNLQFQAINMVQRRYHASIINNWFEIVFCCAISDKTIHNLRELTEIH